jgi:ABC-type transport system involved in cytochrome c biogenesis ATPase subunit
VIALPPAGHWALGSEGQPLAEVLLLLAQRQGLRTAWLGREAGFLSNLSLLENLRLLFHWRDESEAAFTAGLARALAWLQVDDPDWLRQRPSQLREAQLLRASLLRLHLLQPAVLVLQPAALAQAGSVLADQLVATFAEARLLLLAEPTPDWPAWPLTDAPPAVEETVA